MDDFTPTDEEAPEPEVGTVAWANMVLAKAPKDVHDLYRGEMLDAAAILFERMPPDFALASTRFTSLGVDPADYRRVVRRHASEQKRKARAASPRATAGTTSSPAPLVNELTITIYESWAEEIETGALLVEIIDILRRFILLEESEYLAVALWIMMIYVSDLYHVVPYLAVTSVMPNCGKTTLVTLLSLLVCRALAVSNISAASLYRIVDEKRPTLLLDECDSYLNPTNDNADLRGILNSGTTRRLGFVIRSVKVRRPDGQEEYKQVKMATFGPKAIGMIGDVPWILKTRTIEIRMQRIAAAEKNRIEKLTEAHCQSPEWKELCQKLQRWADDYRVTLQEISPSIPDDFAARTEDNWLPLLSIAQLAGEDHSKAALDAARFFVDKQDDDSGTLRIRLLLDVQQIFAEEKEDRLSSAEIIRLLTKNEDGPWIEFGKRKKPITASDLASMLKGFPVRPHQIRAKKDGKETDDIRFNGYMLDDFAHAFRRYLKPKSEGVATDDTQEPAPSKPAPKPYYQSKAFSRATMTATEARLRRDEQVEGCAKCKDDSVTASHFGGTNCIGPSDQKSIASGGPVTHCDCPACPKKSPRTAPPAPDAQNDDFEPF